MTDEWGVLRPFTFIEVPTTFATNQSDSEVVNGALLPRRVTSLVVLKK